MHVDDMHMGKRYLYHTWLACKWLASRRIARVVFCCGNTSIARAIALIVTAALFVCLFVSCDEAGIFSASVYSAHRLHLSVESLSPVLLENRGVIDHFVVSWFDEQFRYRRHIISASTLLSAVSREPSAPLSLISISIALGVPTPIMLTPVAVNGVRFSPAGAVAPLPGVAGNGARHHRATLSWQDGCAVGTLLRAFPLTNGLHGFNIARYLSLVAQYPSHKRCWIDEDSILSLLRNGTMRSTAVRTHPLYETDLPIPEGRWVSSNIFLPPIVSDGKKETPLSDFPHGIFHFFDSRQRSYLRVSLASDGFAVVQQKIAR